jgi:hypothetical protein
VAIGFEVFYFSLVGGLRSSSAFQECSIRSLTAVLPHA